MQPIDSLHDHPKSSIGCIKINNDGLQAMVWVFCQSVTWILFGDWRMGYDELNFPQPSAQKPDCFETCSPLIPFMTIQNHPLDASRSIMMVYKLWFGCFVSQ
jgi:hypothetical protein